MGHELQVLSEPTHTRYAQVNIVTTILREELWSPLAIAVREQVSCIDEIESIFDADVEYTAVEFSNYIIFTFGESR